MGKEMMTTDLRDKIALVTGSGKRSGIGYAVARKLAYWLSRLAPYFYERLMARQLKSELIRNGLKIPSNVR
jgi:enoyl-[acyl-carrier-protein] reductase (NADH)